MRPIRQIRPFGPAVGEYISWSQQDVRRIFARASLERPVPPPCTGLQVDAVGEITAAPPPPADDLPRTNAFLPMTGVVFA